MNKTIKLSDKQKDSLQQIIQQRHNVNAVLQDLNEKENLVLGLILDMHSVQGTVKNVKLDGDDLKFEVEDQKSKKEAKVKKLKPEDDVKA